eukprot:4797014-Prymnesium_polylepis.1
MGKYGHAMGKYGEMWENVGKYGQVKRRVTVRRRATAARHAAMRHAGEGDRQSGHARRARA